MGTTISANSAETFLNPLGNADLGMPAASGLAPTAPPLRGNVFRGGPSPAMPNSPRMNGCHIMPPLAASQSDEQRGRPQNLASGRACAATYRPLALWGVLHRVGNAVLARGPHHASARSRILRINVTRQPRNSGILSGDSQARRRPRGLGPALPRSQTPSEPFAS